MRGCAVDDADDVVEPLLRFLLWTDGGRGGGGGGGISASSALRALAEGLGGEGGVTGVLVFFLVPPTTCQSLDPEGVVGADDVVGAAVGPGCGALLVAPEAPEVDGCCDEEEDDGVAGAEHAAPVESGAGDLALDFLPTPFPFLEGLALAMAVSWICRYLIFSSS